VTYSAKGTNNSIKEIKNQAEEAFQKEICSVNSGEINYINRLIVATTGEINENARKLINKAIYFVLFIFLLLHYQQLLY